MKPPMIDNSKKRVDILGITAKKNTQKYFFLVAAKKLGLSAKEYGKTRKYKDGSLKEKTVLRISNGVKSIFTFGATTSETSYLAMKIAVNKDTTNDILKNANLPVTQQIALHSENDLRTALERFKKIILKPSDSRAGKGIYSNITSLEEAETIYHKLRQAYPNMVAEKIIDGNEYRVLVINGKVFAVAQYVPPSITGDGMHSISTLIEKENLRREQEGDTHHIKTNEALRLNLEDQHLTLESIPQLGETIILHKAAPISSGGYSIDVTERIHPENACLAESVAKIINLNIAGVDIITQDISQPITHSGGAIIEINGGPDLDVHHTVRQGQPRNGAEQILRDYFFSEEVLP